MRGTKFSFAAWLASLIGAAVVPLPLVVLGDWAALDSPVRRAFHMGGLFLLLYLGGFAGLSLWMRLSKKYEAVRPKGWLAAFLLSGALLFGVGAGGQTLFMYGREDVTDSGAVDLVLLLDASGSMANQGYDGPRAEAACQFVDSLEEDCCLQAVSFASIVLDSSPLAVMDDRGKQDIKDFIAGIDSVGATNFNAPLELALDTLEAEGRTECRQAVLLLTDGEGELDNGVRQTYLDSGVLVFTVRIAASAPGDQARALARFAEATGGFDIQLQPGPDGSVDTADLLAAFQEAFQTVTGSRVRWGAVSLLAAGPLNAFQLLVRTLTLAAASLLFSLGFFGRLRPSGAACGMACAAALSAGLLFGGEFGSALNYLAVCILLASAFVRMNVEGGEVVDV